MRRLVSITDFTHAHDRESPGDGETGARACRQSERGRWGEKKLNKMAFFEAFALIFCNNDYLTAEITYSIMHTARHYTWAALRTFLHSFT